MIVTFDDAYADICDYALPVLEHHGFAAAIFVVTRRIGGVNTWDDADDQDALRLMSADQIRAWVRRGMEFGAHTRTHPNLRTLDSARLRTEIEGSAKDLYELLGRRPTAFAYPWGIFDDRSVAMTMEVFPLAFTVDPGHSVITRDPHRLHRFMVKPTDPPLDLSLGFRLGWSPKAQLSRVPPLRWAWRPIRGTVLRRHFRTEPGR